MLDVGVIEMLNRFWVLFVGLVIKKDGIVRFCLDYRKINDVILKDF